MSVQLTYQVFRDYIRIELKGKRSEQNQLEEGIRMWKEIVGICEKERRKRILTISNIEGRLSLGSSFKLTDSLEAIGWKFDYKIAGVATVDILFMSLMMLETIMVNNGYECKMFKSERQAKKWLLQS
jgi:hypothetical protein